MAGVVALLDPKTTHYRDNADGNSNAGDVSGRLRSEALIAQILEAAMVCRVLDAEAVSRMWGPRARKSIRQGNALHLIT